MSIDREQMVRGIVSDLTIAIKDTLDSATKTCINCANFDEQYELCRYRDVNLRPPARVIATGCVSHKDIIQQTNLPF